MDYTEIAEKHGLWPSHNDIREKFIDGAELKEELIDYSKDIERQALERAMKAVIDIPVKFRSASIEARRECTDAIRKLIEELER